MGGISAQLLFLCIVEDFRDVRKSSAYVLVIVFTEEIQLIRQKIFRQAEDGSHGQRRLGVKSKMKKRQLRCFLDCRLL